MKYLLLILALNLVPVVSLSQSAPIVDQANKLSAEQTAALDQAKALNVKVVALYNQQKFGEALKLAKQVQTLIENNHLLDDQSALTMLSNVGEVMLAKGKESEAIALFETVLSAFQRNLGANSVPEALVTERIARAFYNRSDYAKAENYGLKLIALSEKAYGAQDKKLATAYSFLGDIYQLEEKPELAEDAYLKMIAINDKVLNFEENATRTDLDHYYCFLYQSGYKKGRFPEAKAKATQFSMDRIAKSRASRSDTGAEAVPSSKQIVSGGVLDGKALSLARPTYPERMRGLYGFAVVRIIIDEAGNVVEAKGICGMSGFYEVTEQAALKSKFSPTRPVGRPVKVMGTITYHFALAP